MSSADLAAQYGLPRVGARQHLFSYLREVWRRRDFTFSLAQYRIKSENQRNRLGMLWVLLRPILSALVYGLIFGVIMAGIRPHNFAAHVVIGVFMLEFFNASMSGGSKSIVKNTALVQSLPFPRMVLVVAEVLQDLLKFVPTVLLMAVVVIIVGGFPNVGWLLIIPLVVLFTIFNMGVALIFARLTVHFRDLSQFVPVMSRLIFYSSGVIFDPKMLLKDHPGWAAVYEWHPLNEVLSIARGLMMPGTSVNPDHWWMLGIWAVVLCGFGIVFFWKAEERYGREN